MSEFDKLIDSTVSAVDNSESLNITSSEYINEKNKNQDIISGNIETSIESIDISNDFMPKNSDEFFNKFMKEVVGSGIELTNDDIEKLQNNISNIRKSHTGKVRTCNPEKCHHSTTICPFHNIGKYPAGELCPLEILIADNSASQYYKLLEDEYGVSDFNIVEIGTVDSLVAIEIDEFRTRSFMNDDDIIIDTAAFAIKDTGEVVYNKTENPVYNTMERLARRKDKLLQRLLLTPESKARFKVDSKAKRGNDTKSAIVRAEEKIKALGELDAEIPKQQ